MIESIFENTKETKHRNEDSSVQLLILIIFICLEKIIFLCQKQKKKTINETSSSDDLFEQK